MNDRFHSFANVVGFLLSSLPALGVWFIDNITIVTPIVMMVIGVLGLGIQYRLYLWRKWIDRENLKLAKKYKSVGDRDESG